MSWRSGLTWNPERRAPPSMQANTALSAVRATIHFSTAATAFGDEYMQAFRFLAPLAAAFALLLGVPAQAQTVLTMSSWVPPTHHLTRDVLSVWAANVEKATNGRVKFQMLPKHPSAPPGTFDAVRDGLVDVSFVTASYTPARHPLPLLAELPDAGATGEINSVAYSRIHWKYLQAANEYKGVKLLGVFTHGPGQIFTISKPVRSVADLAGMKIRSGGGISEAAAKVLGASPFFKPASDSYEILSSGIADGIFFPLESIKSFNLDKVIKYATLFPGGFYSSSFGFFMNEEKWNSLSKQDQDAISSVSGEALARLAGRSWDAADKVGMEALKVANVTVIEASPEFVADVRKRTEPLVQEWIKSANAKGIDGAKVYAEFHEELKKVAAGK
jgi:TRAP-type C4-dicarboxylate transport system substrate-binding protein